MNKKLFFGIAIPLIAIVIAILVWQLWFIDRSQNIPNNVVIDTPEGTDILSETVLPTEEWMTHIYIDESAFYPPYNTQKIFFLNTINDKIERGYLHVETGTIALVRGEGSTGAGELSVYVLLQNKQIKKIYSSEYDNSAPYSPGTVGDIRFSPKGGYAWFTRQLFEDSKSVIFNVISGDNIIPDSLSLFLDPATDIDWSEDDRYLAIRNETNMIGGNGSDEIILIDTKNNYSVTSILKLDFDDERGSFDTSDYSFGFSPFDDNEISFNIVNKEGEITHYTYDITTKTLEHNKLNATF